MKLKKIVKMLTPYGFVRIYQKLNEKLNEKLNAKRNEQHVQLVREVPMAPEAPAAVVEVRPALNHTSFKSSSDFWLQTHPHLHPMNLVYDAGADARVHLVISSLERSYLFGGIATCVVIATTLARELRLPLRIVTREGGATQAQYRAVMSAMDVEPCNDVSFYSDSARGSTGQNCPPLYFSDADIFLASSWWTATVIRQAAQTRNVYHIIQEDELMFYPRGDDFLDCWRALSAKDAKYIVNSKYLSDWFATEYPQIHANSASFDPVFSRNRLQVATRQKYKLFMYARLSNPRNLFWFGLKVIEECFTRGIFDSREWDVYFAGDDQIPNIEFLGAVRATNLGVLTWDEYRGFLASVDLGLCLIHTPHPGYPVFDVVSAGGVAVTNQLYTKKSFPCSENIIACELTESDFMAGMLRAVELVKDGAARQRNYLNQEIPNSWATSLADVVDFVKSDMSGRASVDAVQSAVIQA